MRVYLDTGGFMVLFSKEGWEIIEKEFGGESNVIFCISPFTLEEFFFNILYKKKEQEIIKKFCDGIKEDPKERANAFFRKFGERFAEFLSGFEKVGVEADVLFLFANKNILARLTKNVKTYDLLHLLTAVSNRLDGFLTTDGNFVEWLKRNKTLFEKDIPADFKIFLVDVKERELNVLRFGEM